MKRKTLLLILAVVAQPLTAGVYKWVDDKGQVHYGERPPAAESATRMNLEADGSNTPSAKAFREEVRNNLAASEEERASRQEEQDKRKEKEVIAKKEEAMRKKKCSTAKARLDLYQNAGRIYTTDENGERHYVEDRNRAAEQQEVKALVDEWCR